MQDPHLYKEMIRVDADIPLHFGAKYIAEDAASMLLYRFDRTALDGRAVNFERFARHLGLHLLCEYVTGNSVQTLGMVTFEPQRVYLLDGPRDLQAPTVIVERDVIEQGNSGLYNFTLALLCAEALLYVAEQRPQTDGGQLSFGLDSVESVRNKTVSLQDAFTSLMEEEGSAASFALRLCLPKNGFKRQTVELYARMGVNRATVDEEKHLPVILEELAKKYNVPEVVVLARLRECNLY